MGAVVKKKHLTLRLDSHTTPRTISTLAIREYNTHESGLPGLTKSFDADNNVRDRLMDEVMAQVQYFLEDVFEHE